MQSERDGSLRCRHVQGSHLKQLRSKFWPSGPDEGRGDHLRTEWDPADQGWAPGSCTASVQSYMLGMSIVLPCAQGDMEQEG